MFFYTFHHQEIPRRSSICNVTAWPFMRSKNCFSFIFQEDTSRKFLILLLSYFPVFWLQISSTFAVIFADCHGVPCVHVRASSCTALFRVSLAGVGLRCIGLAQKISALCNTGSYVCSFFFICVFILCLALSHNYVFFIPSARSLRFGSRLWKENVFATTSIVKSKAITPEKFACSVLPAEGKSMKWNVLRPL